ncbi:glycosyltransferase family 4 protein [Opitutus sp. GAS368]|jgi:glycosyltransferase involved in cell wall biosynthesis|uniref:glycosyltransferase family 4 protein n=1 Tax=Opitutus sp. GAS368 TaxID=1882749 RepID=UPI000879C8DE|nr:glycosyltransferase family 4 protein [Opitutus sp. GAS368]SDS25485.1 Glycosyltransferase involved in cell wall bisynthesis [Opitutus sp. GAS368]
MSEAAGWQFDVEVHPAGWRFPAGPSWLAGWIFAGENRFVTDLRAWIDGRPFLGLHGLPKPGLDLKFLGRQGPPYSGWVIQVTPHRGAALLRLEARDPAGLWTEFFRVAISVAPDAPECPPPPALSSRLAGLVPPLLRLHAQRPLAPLAGLADEVVSAALAVPLNSLPNPPFHGALEEPRDTGWLRYGRLSVTGWLAHRTAKIRRVTALADAVQESALLHGLARADIGNVFADLPGREHSQFVGHVDLPANQGAPALLKVFAELDNGEKHLAFAQRFAPRVIAGADAPLPPLSRRTFARTLWALRGSARRHGLPLGPGAALLAAAKTAWHTYEAEAPARVRHHRPPAVVAAGPADNSPLRVLVATHNLNFEGAPWFIFELARHLTAQPGVSVCVLSPQEGPMRRVFEAAGMPVEVVDVSPALASASPAEFTASLHAAVKTDWSQIDLLVANTMVSFWAVHLATVVQKPSLLYVHESSAIRRFFEPVMAPALFPLVEEAFRAATRVVFTADSSRTVFDYLDHDHFRLLPSWVDVARIDAFAAAHEKAALRRKHGLDPAAVLLINIGSICERKGQHIYLRAAELLREELRHTYPGKRIKWVMVGARPGLYLDSLRQEAELHGLDNVVFLPETGEIHDFYRLADVFVCTSFEESFPRVLLESAAFRLPIVSTNVNGIAEMLAPDEAWLVPPGDRYQLAEAVKAALAAHFTGDTGRVERARATIVRRFHEANSLPLHLALAREAARR